MHRLYSLIPRGSFVLAATTLGSYAAGLFRDRIFAHTFGASRTLDAYNAAFLLPDFLFNVFVASGIAAAFVPLFTDLAKLGRSRAEAYTNTVITAGAAFMTVLGVVLVVFAKPAARLLAPGFDEVDITLVARILRILALTPILFAASNAVGAMLVAERRFFFYGLSPILYNVGIIAGTLLLAPRYGITGVALGTVGGALLHFIARAIDGGILGYRFRPRLAVRTPEFARTIRLMIPKMLGHPVELATFWGFTAIASAMSAGSVAVLNFARNFESVPVSIIGIAVATAVFPTLAAAASGKSPSEFRRVLKHAALLIFVASALSAALMFLLREFLIGVLLGGKAFGPEAIARTAATLGVFTLAIPTEALSQLYARAFYATKNTAIPVALSVMSLGVAVGGAWVLAPTLEIFALPLTFAVASALKLILMLVFLPRRLGALQEHNKPLPPELAS